MQFKGSVLQDCPCLPTHTYFRHHCKFRLLCWAWAQTAEGLETSPSCLYHSHFRQTNVTTVCSNSPWNYYSEFLFPHGWASWAIKYVPWSSDRVVSLPPKHISRFTWGFPLGIFRGRQTAPVPWVNGPHSGFHPVHHAGCPLGIASSVWIT